MLETLDAVILAGGPGTRLQPAVREIPKCLAMINNLPFLAYKIAQLKESGFKRFILCVGYQAKEIKDYFRENPVSGVTIIYAQENEPLGTAGACKNAEPLIESENILVLNGDCYLDIDYRAFVIQHRETLAEASLALVRREDPRRYGLVMFNQFLKISAFFEKKNIAPASHPSAAFYVSAGTYCFHRSLLDKIPPKEPCSLEYNIFPKLIGRRFYAFPISGYFIDIGTPESLLQMQRDIQSGRLKVAS